MGNDIQPTDIQVCLSDNGLSLALYEMRSPTMRIGEFCTIRGQVVGISDASVKANSVDIQCSACGYRQFGLLVPPGYRGGGFNSPFRRHSGLTLLPMGVRVISLATPFTGLLRFLVSAREGDVRVYPATGMLPSGQVMPQTRSPTVSSAAVGTTLW